ncbi:MAG: cytochrome C assembly protein [Candidatus Hydrogenedentota bacterium]|nr:MAG: cytochrome C assembly protein [Candidatus Hydrogenedentota bacterium]
MRMTQILLWLNGFLWFLFFYMVFFVVPSDAAQGVAQRIFYFHVPTAWVSFTAFTVSFIASIRYLKKRDLQLDKLAAAYAVTGWIFTTGVMITGPLWAKPIWGDFWNWSDQRLMSFFVLWLLFAAYGLLRFSMPDSEKRARFSAVLAILGFLNVPLVYAAIRIWNTPSHPAAVIAGKKGSGLKDPTMLWTFFIGVIAFHFLMWALARALKTYYIQKSTVEQQIWKNEFKGE